MKLDRKKFEVALAHTGKTITEVCAEAGISTLSVTPKRRAKHALRPRTIGRLAKALGVEVEELLED